MADEGGAYMVCELSEKYLQQTACLLNTEWPRSLSQRLHSLEAFMTTPNGMEEMAFKMPVSLILVHKEENKVVAHASLVTIATTNSKTNQTDNLCFLQSLVVDKSLRGKGLGKKLVKCCEEYVLQLANKSAETTVKFDHLYLTTKDQQTFYERIGFVRTEPILFFTLKNSNSKCFHIMNHLMNSMQQNSENPAVESKSTSQVSASATCPPPPPPPPFMKPGISKSELNNLPTWYKKSLIKSD